MLKISDLSFRVIPPIAIRKSRIAIENLVERTRSRAPSEIRDTRPLSRERERERERVGGEGEGGGETCMPPIFFAKRDEHIGNEQRNNAYLFDSNICNSC